MNREEFEKQYGINHGDLAWVIEGESGNSVLLRSGIYIPNPDYEENFSLVEFAGVHMGACIDLVTRGSYVGWYERVRSADKIEDFKKFGPLIREAFRNLEEGGSEE
jgi:hypothetical protein